MLMVLQHGADKIIAAIALKMFEPLLKALDQCRPQLGFIKTLLQNPQTLSLRELPEHLVFVQIHRGIGKLLCGIRYRAVPYQFIRLS